jgi:hypothetical protein
MSMAGPFPIFAARMRVALVPAARCW